MIGWFTDSYIIDSAGLVSPWLVREHPDEYGRDSLESATVRFRPNYIFEAFRPVPKVVQDHYDEKFRVSLGGPHGAAFLLLKHKSKRAQPIKEH